MICAECKAVATKSTSMGTRVNAAGRLEPVCVLCSFVPTYPPAIESSQDAARRLGALVLEGHDHEPPTLCFRRGHIDGSLTLDYQAEHVVSDTADIGHLRHWLLFDADGLRARWHRPSGDYGLPRLSFASNRWCGTWSL